VGETMKGTKDMDREELNTIGQKLFAAAMRDAKERGETVMEGGHDEHAWRTLTGRELILAATDYFDAAIA
jgi:hypothetical protein